MSVTGVVCALLPAPAFAQTAVAIASPAAPVDKRFELDVGMLLGSTDVGDATGPGHGLVLNAGIRVEDASLLAELDYIAVGDEYDRVDARRGRMTRVGVLGRYSLIHVGGGPGAASGDVWVEAGLGRHQVAWNEGGELTRADAVAGIGFQLNGRVGPDERYFGPYFALRTHLARSPDGSADPTCGGPCDEMTLPSRNDISWFFHFGINWGR